MRIYYVFDSNPNLEYEVSDEKIDKQNADITVYVTFKRVYISVKTYEDGVIGISSNYNPNDVITVTVVPSEGYYVSRLYYVNENNTEVDIENNKFSWDGSNIAIKAEIIYYYGSYVVDLDSVDNYSYSEEELIAMGYSFISLDQDYLKISELGEYEYIISECKKQVEVDVVVLLWQL